MEMMMRASEKTRKDKILELLKIRNITLGSLRRSAGLSRATMSRLMNSPKGYTPSAETLEKISSVLEVNPLYLKDEDVLGPGDIFPYLTEDDIKFFMDLKNLPFIKLSREMAQKGLSPDDMRKLAEILLSTRENDQ